MKALCLTQPWATLMAIGAKQYETRSWRTRYHGLVALCAAKNFPRACRDLIHEDPFRQVLGATGWHEPKALPRGVILAVGFLSGCDPTDQISVLRRADGSLVLSDQERAFGDYSPGRWAWLFHRVMVLARPLPVVGSLGLFDLPSHTVEAIVDQIPQTRFA